MSLGRLTEGKFDCYFRFWNTGTRNQGFKGKMVGVPEGERGNTQDDNSLY